MEEELEVVGDEPREANPHFLPGLKALLVQLKGASARAPGWAQHLQSRPPPISKESPCVAPEVTQGLPGLGPS